MKTAVRYKAFISYSHLDNAWAKWLHKELENFKLDKSWVRECSLVGDLNDGLRPIFRDRDEFTPGYTLSEQTLSALDASAALIPICSRSAAKSFYVSEEIRLFISRHPMRVVIPVIVNGRPDGGDDECFPPTLKYRIGPDARPTNTRTELLAADVQHRADGPDLALAKVVARLLALETDDVFRRWQRHRRKQHLVRGVMAGLVSMLLVAGAFFAWQDFQKRRALDDVRVAIAKLSPANERGGPETEKTLTDAITGIALGAAQDPRYQDALQLLKLGEADKAVPLLEAAANAKVERVRKDTSDAAAAFRHLAAIAGLGHPAKAREYYLKALELDPSNLDALYWSGYLTLLSGDIRSANTTLQKLLAASEQNTDERGMFLAHLRLGEIDLARGNFPNASDHQQKALDIAARWALTGDPSWKRNLCASFDKLGDLSRSQGALDQALQHFEKCLDIALKLAKSDVQNIERQRDVAISEVKVGDVNLELGEPILAFNRYRNALFVVEEIVGSRTEAPGWQSDLAVVHERLGTALRVIGELDEARKNFDNSLRIRSRLLDSHPANSTWSHALSVSEEKLGDLLFAEGSLQQASKHYGASRNAREKLVHDHPDDLRWRRDLSVSLNKQGDLLQALGKHSDAMVEYQRALEIRRRLVEQEPENVGRQVDLATSYARLGQINLAKGERVLALENFVAGRSIMEPIAATTNNRRWRSYLEKFNLDIRAAQKE